jgi:hypothetical protein
MPESFKKFSAAILETHCLDLGRGVAIHVNLPVLRCQGREVVGKEVADACAHVAEDCMCRLLAGHPEMNGDGLPPTLDDRVSEANLAVQLERPCLHGNRARLSPAPPSCRRS